MTTSLATQRNFVIANPSTVVAKSNTTSPSTSHHLVNGNDIKNEVITISANNTITDENGLQLNDVLAQKKIIIQSDNDEIPILNVVPIDASDSSNGESDSMHDLSVIKDGLELAQVTLVQAPNIEDGTSPQYITVTEMDPNIFYGKLRRAQLVLGDGFLIDDELAPDSNKEYEASQSHQDSYSDCLTVPDPDTDSEPDNENVPSNSKLKNSVSTQDTGGGQNSYQVQYVDTELYHSSSSQSQMTYPFCPVGDYQTSSQSYYSTTGNYTTTNTPPSHASGLPYLVPGDENLLLTSSSQSRDSPPNLTEVSYLHDAQTPTSTTPSTGSSVANGGGPGSNSGAISGSSSNGAGLNVGDTNNLANANKIASATIKWLTRNYETAEGVSLPRSTLYNHYMQHCNENKSEPVNAASFGKLIRSVFSGLRTRRLGTRGNSKYHYYGIRIKPGSTLSHTMDDKPGQSFSGQHANGGTLNGVSGGSGTNSTGLGGGHISKKKHGVKADTFETCSQYLGDGSVCIPIFPHIEIDNTFNNELTLEDVETFRSMYREHCESFLDAVLNLEFSTIEYLWRDFWRSSDNNNLDECEEEKYLSKTKLYLLCHCAGVQKFIKQVDYQFYQNVVDVLIPDVLRSIPNSLTHAIRNFAKNLEIWLCESMVGVPERMIQIKSSAVSAFCQTLRRYTSLNHLAQAARAVLQNNTQITQMLTDLNRVDFHNVQEQAAWVCQCDTSIVQRLENDFKAALQQQNTLEQWAVWLRLVVDSALEEYRDKPNYAKAARQFLLKWSFYSSMVIRDLTLRSAPSFGSFHLIRLLYDEYMFFLVEHKVAEALQKTAIAVISDRMQKDNDFEFDYQLEFIDGAETNSIKRMKHE